MSLAFSDIIGRYPTSHLIYRIKVRRPITLVYVINSKGHARPGDGPVLRTAGKAFGNAGVRRRRLILIVYSRPPPQRI